MKLLLAVFLPFVLLANHVRAQAPNPLLDSTRTAKDLTFPTKESRFPSSGSGETAVYKPDGAGPFPALVLFPGCGGFRNDKNWQNLALLEWAKVAVARGYVAFPVDTMGPRGVVSTCLGIGGSGLHNGRSVRDALQAAEHLRKFDYVDKNRVAFVGHSWGGTKGLLVSSRFWASSLAPSERFNAVVSFYPDCYQAKPQAGRPYDVVRTDIDRPLLVLMSDNDTETPPETCVPGLKAAKDRGAPVEWHIYKGPTHCWDCKNLDNHRFTNIHGNQVVYRYDAGVTMDSERRLFEFLDRVMPAKN